MHRVRPPWLDEERVEYDYKAGTFTLPFEYPFAEGVGKTTNIDVVCRLLEANGVPFIKTREPGGTPLAEALREAVMCLGTGGGGLEKSCGGVGFGCC